MDASHFGLTRNPFERNPSLDEACLPPPFGELVQELINEFSSPKSVQVVLGESGAGKTMVASVLAARLGRDAAVARLTVIRDELDEVLREILEQLEPGLATGRDVPALETLVQSTAGRLQSGIATVLILDDAHRLRPAAVASLCGFRAHVVLLGRPALAGIVEEALGERPGRRASDGPTRGRTLSPLKREAALAYVADRVATAGGRVEALFAPAALARIVDESGGFVTRLESLGAGALDEAQDAGVREVGIEHVERALRHDEGDDGEEHAAAGSAAPFTPELEGAGEGEASPGGAEWSDQPEEWAPPRTAKPEDVAWPRPEEPVPDAPTSLEAILGEIPTGVRPERAGPYTGGSVAPPVPDDVERAVPPARDETLPGPPPPPPSDPAANRRGRSPRRVRETFPPSAPPPSKGSTVPWHTWWLGVLAIVLVLAVAWQGLSRLDRPQSRPVPQPVVRPGEEWSAMTEGEGGGGTGQEPAPLHPDEMAADPTDSANPTPAGTRVRSAAGDRVTSPGGRVTPPGGAEWVIQIGAFRSRRNAEGLLRELRELDPQATIRQRGELHCVVTRAFPSEAAATAFAESVKEGGFSTYVRRWVSGR